MKENLKQFETNVRFLAADSNLPVHDGKPYFTIRVFHETFGEGGDVVAFLREKLQHSASTPTFAFLDPFGYKSVTMESVNEFLTGKESEVFINLNMRGLLRVVNESKSTDGAKVAARKSLQRNVTEIFGDDTWKSVQVESDTRKRRRILVKAYKNTLIEKCGAKFAIEFGMRNEKNGWVYYLVYATKHPKGLELMKNCMNMATTATIAIR